MPPEQIAAFLQSPYGLIADVKLLNFFRDIGTTAAIVIAALLAGSLVIKNPWCRYLCPYGALMGVVSIASPVRIRRNPVSCIDCNKCTQACPSYIPVAKLFTVKTAECAGYLECVSACPVADALELGLTPTARRVPGWAVAAASRYLFVGIVGYAKVTHRWQDTTRNRILLPVDPELNAFSH